MEKANAWISVVANVGVLIGIVFVIVELNQTQATNEREANEHLNAAFTSLRMQIADNPNLADVYVRGLRDPASLNAVEALRFNSMMATYTYTFASLYDRANEGLVSWREPFREWFTEQFDTPGGRLHFDCVKTMQLDPEFIEFIESMDDGRSKADASKFRCSGLFHGPVVAQEFPE